MIASRLFGFAFLIFLVSLPVTYFMQNVASDADASTALNDEHEQQDDPIVDVYCLKGLAAMEKLQFDKAIAAYTAAINRDSQYSFAYVGRGDAYLAQGDADRALVDYDHAVRLDPSNAAAKARADAVRKDKANP
ncbi:MAG TPA: tetratricopeptide repeat protein [Gemmataceae bacterium]|nr:tetratricopeptide repeat protein [Gemmataceae bacterium]